MKRENVKTTILPESYLEVEHDDEGILYHGMLFLRTICSCDEFKEEPNRFNPERDVALIADFARANGTTRVVLTGGCDGGRRWMVNQVKQSLRDQGIDLVWIGWQRFGDNSVKQGEVATSEEFVNHYLGLQGQAAFKFDINSWHDVLQVELLLPHLVALAERFKDIRKKIEQELKWSLMYPIARKVISLRPPQSEALEEWLGVKSDKKTGTKWLIGFTPDRKRCRIWSKTGEKKFEIVGDPHKDSLLDSGFYIGFSEDSPLIIKDNRDVPFRLATEPGVWYIKPHSALEPSNPDQVWIPTSQRLKRCESLRCEGDGQEFSGSERCIHCGQWVDAGGECLVKLKQRQLELTEFIMDPDRA